MAWFDILANVGSAAEQSTANFQRLLLQQRELQERQRQQEEERRRWEASERRATLAEQRAAEEAARARTAEERTTKQFELGLKREAEQRVEQQLRQYGADPIPQEVVDALALEAPGAVKNLIRKAPSGEWRLRMGPEEELKATQARRATQLLSIPEADIAKQPMAARKELGRLRGDENMYLTPKEVEAEVRRSPGYLITLAQANAYAAQRDAVTLDDKMRANYLYAQDYKAGEEALRDDEQKMREKLDDLLDAHPKFGRNVKGQGWAAFEEQRQKNAPLAEAQYLQLANRVRQLFGLPPAAQWDAPLQQIRSPYAPPFPDLPGAGAAKNLRARPGDVKGETMKTPSGRTVVTFVQQ